MITVYWPSYFYILFAWYFITFFSLTVRQSTTFKNTIIWKHTNVVSHVKSFLPDLQFNSSSPLGQSLSPSHNQRLVIHCPWLHWSSSSAQVTPCAKANYENNKLRSKQNFFICFNAIQGGGSKRPPYQFFPCNFYKRRN